MSVGDPLMCTAIWRKCPQIHLILLCEQNNNTSRNLQKLTVLVSLPFCSGVLVYISSSSNIDVHKRKRERIKKRWLREMVWPKTDEIITTTRACMFICIRNCKLWGLLVNVHRWRGVGAVTGSLFILLGWSWASERPHKPLNRILKRGQ